MISCARYCESNKTLLRYFDLREIITFIEYINSNNLIEDDYKIDTYFTGNISDITMNRLKEYYLDLLLLVEESDWNMIYTHLNSVKRKKFDFVEKI